MPCSTQISFMGSFSQHQLHKIIDVTGIKYVLFVTYHCGGQEDVYDVSAHCPFAWSVCTLSPVLCKKIRNAQDVYHLNCSLNHFKFCTLFCAFDHMHCSSNLNQSYYLLKRWLYKKAYLGLMKRIHTACSKIMCFTCYQWPTVPVASVVFAVCETKWHVFRVTCRDRQTYVNH